MVPERALLGGAAGVVIVGVVLAAALPGVVAEQTEPIRPGYLAVEEVTIAPGEVSGETATLTIETRLAHRGGPSENVSVLLRATSLDSGLVATTRSLPVEPVSGDREVAVVGNVSVERAGGYRIEAIVFQDGERVDEAGKEVRGVGTLQPAYARSPVTFHRFEGAGPDQPVIEYSIESTSADRTTLRVSTYLTNTGDGTAGDLRLALKARQAESNIVAAETEVTVSGIAPGHTEIPTATLTVPDGYNYYLDAILWKDGVIVGSARSAANLDPTETLSVNETRRSIGLDVSDFEPDDGEPRPRERTPMPTEARSPGQPGFTAGVAALALLAAGFLLWRRSV